MHLPCASAVENEPGPCQFCPRPKKDLFRPVLSDAECTTIDVLAAGHLRLVVEAIDRHIHVLFCLPCVYTTRFEHGASFAIVCYGNVST